MSILLSQNMFSIGASKLGISLASLASSEMRSDFDSVNISIAFIDSIFASELIIKASILKAELESSVSRLSENIVTEARRIELIAGSSRLSFLELPQELYRVSGREIQNPDAYYKMSDLRKTLFSEGINPNNLMEPTLKFAFESIEPLMIDMWDDIILLHVSELNFEVDRYIEDLLVRYNISVSDHNSYEDD